ncbi:hypothetical protein [Thermovenabulum gondwanense]|uniref:Uncharacterized protein n=1 Tax=Thermovenabulum gondwanense TaxID=520767 RepID=A0A162MVN9_9FIRM|nr:hypothetical protein [Thermovenabulum gondwanense]KYO67838.1 hypothetical protein ATZ99_04780 [Thermovenabulum gondwanense]
MLKDLEFSINLYTEGERFFDLLKVLIRDAKKSPWPHERERAIFAEGLLKKALETYEEAVKHAEEKVVSGFCTEEDKRLVKEMRRRLDYWRKKYEELSMEKVGSSCGM